MKTIKILFFFLLTIFSFGSCKKFLTEVPKSQIPVDAYYKTAQEAQSAANYLYTQNNGPGSFFSVGGLYDGTNSFVFDNLSGMVNNLVAQDPSLRYFSNLTQNAAASGNYLDNIWANFYNSISSANTIIEKVQHNTAIDSVTKNSVLATAKFYRALDYYYLVRIFGALPLVVKPYESLTNLYLPRTSVDSVYKTITSDLQWAYTNGGLADKPMGSNGNLISKGTVAIVLAEVYQTMAGYPLLKGQPYYTLALNMANTILTSTGGYALFTTNTGSTAFDKLRLTANDQGSEYLFFMEYNPAIQQSAYPEYSFPNTFPLNLPNSNLQVQYTLVTQVWSPTTSLLGMYDSINDIRRHEKQFYSSSFNYITKSGQSASVKFSQTMPYRWYDSIALFNTASSGKYTSVYRMADAYLIAAEASNELGQDPSPYLQPILNRAYITTPVIPGDQLGRRNLILAERVRELAMEGHFWFDMLRTRLYPDADVMHHVTFSNLIGHSNGRGQSYAVKDLLMPLPPTEIQRDPNLKPQNPGY